MRNLTMMTDLYELTMMNGYLRFGMENNRACFDIFYRKQGDMTAYAVAAGLEQAVEYVKNLHFSKDDIAYLRSLNIFDEAFLTRLSTLRFTGEILAVPEGTVIFPGEPIVRVIAPIMEELLFRGLILQTLKRYGNVFAILVTSLLFALLHGNLPQSVPVFALSMMICYVVLTSGSILPGIAIHFLNNAFAIMEVSLLSDNGQISTVFLILEALFLLYAMFTLYQKRLIIRNYIIHNRGSRVRTFFSNWISILFLVLCVFIMITSFQRT